MAFRSICRVSSSKTLGPQPIRSSSLIQSSLLLGSCLMYHQNRSFTSRSPVALLPYEGHRARDRGSNNRQQHHHNQGPPKRMYSSPPAQKEGSGGGSSKGLTVPEKHFRTVLKFLLASTATGNLVHSCHALEEWRTNHPEEIHSLTRSEKNILQKFLSVAAKKEESGTSIADLIILSNVALHSRNIPWAMSFLSKLHAKGPSPSPDAIALLFGSCAHSPAAVDKVLNWVDEHKLEVNVPLAIKVVTSTPPREKGDKGSSESSSLETNLPPPAAPISSTWEAAFRIARKFQNVYTEPYTAQVVVPYLSTNGHWEEAIRVVGSYICQGFFVDSGKSTSLLLQQMVSACASHAGHWQSAFQLMSHLQRCFLTEELHSNEMFTTVSESIGKWEASVACFLIATNPTGINLTPNEEFLSSVLHKCNEAGQWGMATRIYERCVAEGFLKEAKEKSIHALIEAFQMSRQWVRCVEALEWMSHVNTATSQVGYAALLHQCVGNKMWEVALNIGPKLLQNTSDVTTSAYIALAEACSLGSRWEEALRLNAQLVDTIDTQSSPLVPISVMKTCLQSNKWELALSVFSQQRQMIPRVTVTPAAYSLAMQACGMGKQSEVSLQLLEELHAHQAVRDPSITRGRTNKTNSVDSHNSATKGVARSSSSGGSRYLDKGGGDSRRGHLVPHRSSHHQHQHHRKHQRGGRTKRNEIWSATPRLPQ